jgi:predicted MFS family arabinose efflux permease
VEAFGARSPAPVYPIVFTVATISAIYHPAFQSIIPALVAGHQLPKANAYVQTVTNLVDLAGPLIGGGAITVFDTDYSLYLTAATFAMSAALILAIDAREPRTAAVGGLNGQAIARDLREGVAYAWANPIIRYACVLFLFSNLATHIFYANFMFFLADILRLTPRDIGITLSLSGIGAVIGALCAPYASARFAAGRIILTCTICAGLTTLLLLCATGPFSVALAWGTVAAFNSVIIVTYFTLRQQSVPSCLLGRTIAVTRLISYAAIPVASLVGGGLLQAVGHIEFLIVLSALIMTVGGILGWLSPLAAPTELAGSGIAAPHEGSPTSLPPSNG